MAESDDASEVADYQQRFRSSRCACSAGATLLHVLQRRASPTPGFEPVAPDLEDLYFAAIKGFTQQRLASAGQLTPCWATIFLFELQQRLRRLSTYVYFVVFFALGLLFTLMSGGAFSSASVDFGTGGKVLINSPYALNGVITYICFFGIVITAAIAGQATYQDIDSNSPFLLHRAHQQVRLPRRTLSGGVRAAGSHLQQRGPRRVGRHHVALARQNPRRPADSRGLLSAVPHQRSAEPPVPDRHLLRAGHTLAQDAARICGERAGADRLLHRRAVSRYGLQTSLRAALGDPLGGAAIDRITRYWTPFERNTQLIPFRGILLANRAFWLGVGAIFLGFTYVEVRLRLSRRARQSAQASSKRRMRPAPSDSLPIAHPTSPPRHRCATCCRSRASSSRRPRRTFSSWC